MITATDLKVGVTFEIGGTPYKVVKYTHQKIGRGGATVKVGVRNLVNGSLEEKTMNSTVKLNTISTVKKPFQFLYTDDKNAIFMDTASYDQIEIPVSLIKRELLYIKEGSGVNALFWEDLSYDGEIVPLSIEIPAKVTLIVKDTTPGVKGNSATNMYKSAKLENNLTVKLPLFIKKGDKVVVDTRTGEYVERAK